MKRCQLGYPIILIIFMTLSASLSRSQTTNQETSGYASKGVIELGGSGSYVYNSSIIGGVEYTNINVFTLSPFIGYFVTDNFELGLNPIGYQRIWHGDNASTNVSIFLCPSYCIRTDGRMFPFVEAQLGYNAQTSSSPSYSIPTRDGISWGVRAGMKYAFPGHGVLNLALQYQQLTLKSSNSPSRDGSDIFSLSAGFSIWF